LDVEAIMVGFSFVKKSEWRRKLKDQELNWLMTLELVDSN
jgi:hypothetical protein